MFFIFVNIFFSFFQQWVSGKVSLKGHVGQKCHRSVTRMSPLACTPDALIGSVGRHRSASTQCRRLFAVLLSRRSTVLRTVLRCTVLLSRRSTAAVGAIISVGTCAPVDVHLIHPPSKTTSYQSYTSAFIQSAYFLFKSLHSIWPFYIWYQSAPDHHRHPDDL